MRNPVDDQDAASRPRPLRWRMMLLSILFALCAWWRIVAWQIDAVGRQQSLHRAQAAVILGAAAYDARPSPVFAERLNHGLTLYRRGQVSLLMLTGARAPGARYSEAAVGRRYLMARGIPASAIRMEERSRTTQQNLAEARRVLAPAGIDDVLVVSDPAHLYRALSMARSQGFRAEGAPTPTSAYRSWQTRVPFILREILFVHIWWATGQ